MVGKINPTARSGVLRAKRPYHRSRKGKPRQRPHREEALPKWLRPRHDPQLPVISPRNLKVMGTFLATYDECAAFFGIAPLRLVDLMRSCPELRAAWDQGRHLGRMSLRRRQLEIAYSNTPQAATMLIHLGKTILRQSEKRFHEHSGAGSGPARYTEIRRTIVDPARPPGQREVDLAALFGSATKVDEEADD